MEQDPPPGPDRGDPTAVSVVVLGYNHEEFIEQCLDSVAGQAEVSVQLIVMDDGSSDRTLDVVRSWRQRAGADCTIAANERNLGLTATLNRAIGIAQEEHVVLIGGDDWLEPGRLAAQVAHLCDAPPEVMAVAGDLRRVDEDGHPVDEQMVRVEPDDLDRATIAPAPDQYGAPDQFTSLLEANWVPAPSVMLRHAAFQIAGPYDETLPSEDLWMWLQLTSRGFRIDYLPGVAANYRQHGSSMTSGMRPNVVAGTVRLFLSHLGRSGATDKVIWRRVSRFALALHAEGYRPQVVRSYLWRSFLHRPSRRLGAAVIESTFRRPAGAVSRIVRRRPR